MSFNARNCCFCCGMAVNRLGTEAPCLWPRSAGAEDPVTFPGQALSAQEMQLTYMTSCLSAPQPNHTANLTRISAGLSTAWPALAARLSVCLRHQHGEHELSQRPVSQPALGAASAGYWKANFQKKQGPRSVFCPHDNVKMLWSSSELLSPGFGSKKGHSLKQRPSIEELVPTG